LQITTQIGQFRRDGYLFSLNLFSDAASLGIVGQQFTTEKLMSRVEAIFQAATSGNTLPPKGSACSYAMSVMMRPLI
jgi:hypothetical protein